ncbi:MAG TPA: glucosidase, partial [Isosphaeraceae bacterium]
TKFFEHFLAIAHAINGICGQIGMWHEADGFYYDVVRAPGGTPEHLRIRSLVGLVPLFATLTIAPGTLDRLPRFRRRMEWFLAYRPTLVGHACLLTRPGAGGHLLLAVADREKLARILPRVLDPEQFLSEHGVRSMSRGLAAEPYRGCGGMVAYEPAESTTAMYGGNSNWRGPVWFPVNYLMIGALREYARYYGDALRVELPRESGRSATLGEVADELARRLVRLFLRDAGRGGRRPVLGEVELFQTDPHWRDYIPFHEYFHGDHGAGLGASHQTGWTALVGECTRRLGTHGRPETEP